MRPRRPRESRLQLLTDVQMTSFMDMSFLLLIVFLLTAPVIEYGMDVSPPKLNSKPLVADKSYVITLNNTGRITFQKQEMGLAELARKLAFMAEAQPELSILIRADQKREYGQVIEIMRVVRGARIGNVALVTQVEDLK